MAAQVLVAVLGTNSDFAVDQFSTLCDAPDQLLGTRAVEDFVYYSVNTHPSQIVPIIQRMRSADDVKARMAGTRQACLAALSTDEYRTLLKDCIEGPEESRSEAAGILARNLTAASRKTECSAALIALFNDPDLSVRMKASECFQFFKKDELRGAEELIMSFVDSTAFSTGCGGLLYAVDRTTAPLPRITLHVCERYIASVGGDGFRMANSSVSSSEVAGNLIVRVYSQVGDEAFKSRCLDVIDRMSELEVLGLHRALDSYER
jgi:hypothetical protein